MKIQNIKLNEKVTIIAENHDILGLAMCTVIKGIIKDVQIVQYAQYNAAIQIRYREQRKRKDRILTIINEKMVILKGFHDIDKSIKTKIDDNSRYINANTPAAYFNHKDLMFKKDQIDIETYDSYESIIDLTGDYLISKRFDEGIKGEAAKDEGYFKLIKDILVNLNFSICDDMFKCFTSEGCTSLIEDIKKVRFTIYDI